MKKYSADDIKVVKWDEHARNYPKMYFGEEGASPEGIADGFDYVAKILGAQNTKTKNIDDWWYFCSDMDWIFKSSIELGDIEEVFLSLRPFPEAESPNSFRCEALSTPFSTDVYTWANEKLVVIKGQALDQDTLNAHLNALGKWGRIVGYKFNENT